MSLRKDKLIILDIDGTLLDERYNTNNTKLPALIRQLQDTGHYFFILNSNRSLEDILPIAHQHAIEGLIVGENGIFVYNVKTGETSFFLSEEERKNVIKLKQKIEGRLKQILKSSYPALRIIWEDTDTVKALSQSDTSKKYKEGEIVVLNNLFRRYTISAHIYRSHNGALRSLTLDEIKNITGGIRDICDKNNLTVEYDSVFSNILVYSKATSKRMATEKLMSNFPNCQLFSIGDSMNDFKVVDGIGTFLTVNNAKKDVQKKAVKTSRQPFALGVEELLRQL
jgi:hydroxymethylpyrimidine pyrophosphatase-like HAD family hydrolase